MTDTARDFAAHYHTHETISGVPDTWGGESYMDAHLRKVVAVILHFSEELLAFGVTREELDALIRAAYLHDTVEDTDATIRLIARKFGRLVAKLVWAVTGVGDTRKIRNADMQRKIKKYVLAAILKLADRIANVEGSTEGTKHREMYYRELASFETYIRPHVPAAMWDRLIAAFGDYK